jgi:hypothetical protein
MSDITSRILAEIQRAYEAGEEDWDRIRDLGAELLRESLTQPNQSAWRAQAIEQIVEGYLEGFG